MGLNNNQNNGGKTTYLNIVGGKITRRYTEHQLEENGKPVTFEREIKDKDGNVVKKVIERYYDDIDGMVQSAEIDASGSFGAMLVFKIVDGEEFTLSIPLDSSYGIAVMKKIPNVDPLKVLKFAPFNFESSTEMKNGEPKKIVGCNLFQGNDKIQPAWTAENPGSLPRWKQSETTGKWDNTAFLEFLGGHFKQWASKVDPFAVPTPKPSAVQMDGDPEEMTKGLDEIAAKNAESPTLNNDSEPDGLPF